MYLFRNNDIVRNPRGALVRGRAGLRATLAALALGLAPAVFGQGLLDAPMPGGSRDDRGHFEVRAASAVLRDGVYLVDAAIDYRLSSEAAEALLSGVPLTIRLDFQVLSNRRWWFDDDAAVLRQLFRLSYHSLSERYLLANVNAADQQRSFPTLAAALAALGRIDDFPVIDATVLNPNDSYDLRMRAVLDVEGFSGPLRLLAFWRRDWSLASDWYRWRLSSD